MNIAAFKLPETEVVADPTDIYFPVSTQEFSVPFGDQMADASQYKAVVREDTGKVLGIHSRDYHLVTNETLFSQLEEAIHESTIDTTDMKTSVRINDGGGSVEKVFRFPAHKIEPQVGDIVEMELRVRNSYDGRWAFGTILGGNRLACTNGMTVSSHFSNVYSRHTKNLNVERAIKKLDGSVKIYLDHADLWTHWAHKKVSNEQIQELLFNEDILDIPVRFRGLIWDFYQNELDAGNQGIWALFNALTYWSTHHKTRKGAQQSVVQDDREKRVRNIITSPAFKKIAA